VRGIVQGVGFRPFVYSHASRMSLTGRVRNNVSGVLIDVEGSALAIQRFVHEIGSNPPPLSQIESIEYKENLPPAGYPDFLILESNVAGDRTLPVSADFGTCNECVRELFDQRNRRYRYPFINCTNCGPRFTIVEDVPYDRARTTMRHFKMCHECRVEYENPLDRRFHAEPIACATCGPRLFLRDRAKELLLDDLITRSQELLRAGKVVAIKGIGGYHLACDASSDDAVNRLRQRKYREDKPFALMARSVDVVRQHCNVSDVEERVLLSSNRPIVLLERKPACVLPTSIAPNVQTLGFMLPYTPLHYLLVEKIAGPLVMTSANVSDEPICYSDEDARLRLGNIADYFLLHDREINIRTDDSVVRVFNDRELMVRRSRGYAPAPIRTAFRVTKPILACGAELKSTFCLARDHDSYLSHHIGDLENFETLMSFKEGISHFQRLFGIEPELVAYDLHPDYLSTKYAQSLEGPEKIGVQHHHAHIASCMADNGIDGELIGVAMDGLGFGLDGKLWGGEFLVADFEVAERVAHLAYVPLAGGAKAVREPWRLAAIYLQLAFANECHALKLDFNERLTPKKWSSLRSMVAAKVNSPETSSMGRLFDAMAGLLCLRESVNYEGQAAIELETIAADEVEGFYEFLIDGKQISALDVIRGAVRDLLDGVSHAEISGKFHLGVANLILSMAEKIKADRGLKRVALSGGVFQNMLLVKHVCGLLGQAGFEVFTHSRVPTNDGGISLGQAAIANARANSGRCH
jgi:hydrogenase maturation protein HypF